MVDSNTQRADPGESSTSLLEPPENLSRPSSRQLRYSPPEPVSQELDQHDSGEDLKEIEHERELHSAGVNSPSQVDVVAGAPSEDCDCGANEGEDNHRRVVNGEKDGEDEREVGREG